MEMIWTAIDLRVISSSCKLLIAQCQNGFASCVIVHFGISFPAVIRPPSFNEMLAVVVVRWLVMFLPHKHALLEIFKFMQWIKIIAFGHFFLLVSARVLIEQEMIFHCFVPQLIARDYPHLHTVWYMCVQKVTPFVCCEMMFSAFHRVRQLYFLKWFGMYKFLGFRKGFKYYIVCSVHCLNENIQNQ